MEDELLTESDKKACIMDSIEKPERNGEIESKETDGEKTCEGCSHLEVQLSVLREELETLKKKCEKTEKLLEKAEFERDSSSKYVDSFREQVKQLHEKLTVEKKKNENLEKQMQEKGEQLNEDKESTAEVVNADSNLDIASSIREAAKDIATSIREAAQQATTSHGFVFDETTGLYYDHNTGYYYDPNTRLYYDYRTGIYYTYNQEKRTYEFYSQVSSTTNPSNDTNTQTTTADVTEKTEIKKIELVESGSEDGEIVEVEELGDSEETRTKDDDDDGDEVRETEFPPCIRAIVMQSEELPAGSLNVITCMGRLFGRVEGSGSNLKMSDIEVSKEHAKVYYDEESKEYYIKDLGSQNGTFINGSRLSESKQESEAYKLSHGEQLKIGSTIFLLHIHPGSETCDECEPGQVQAQLKLKEAEDEVEITCVVSAASEIKDTNALRKKELKRLKKRYMLENSDHEVNSEIASNNAGKYKDRAQTRRIKVGSDAPNSDVAEAPASVFKPIKDENKGRLMLQKMGWVDGEGLGKTKTGRVEPVMATIRETGRGLGYGGVKSLDMQSSKNPKSFTWRKTQERYRALGRGRNVTSSQSALAMNWVKKAPKPPESLDIFADNDDT